MNYIPERERSAPGKKNTRRWCKGVVGREHQREIVIPTNRSGWRAYSCGWYTAIWPWFNRMKDRWYCIHVEQCSVCLKVLNSELRERCPLFPETTS